MKRCDLCGNRTKWSRLVAAAGWPHVCPRCLAVLEDRKTNTVNRGIDADPLFPFAAIRWPEPEPTWSDPLADPPHGGYPDAEAATTVKLRRVTEAITDAGRKLLGVPPTYHVRIRDEHPPR